MATTGRRGEWGMGADMSTTGAVAEATKGEEKIEGRGSTWLRDGGDDSNCGRAGEVLRAGRLAGEVLGAGARAGPRWWRRRRWCAVRGGRRGRLVGAG